MNPIFAIRPYQRHPDFWGDLLAACRGRDERAMAALRRQGKLLFCGELIESPQMSPTPKVHGGYHPPLDLL